MGADVAEQSERRIDLRKPIRTAAVECTGDGTGHAREPVATHDAAEHDAAEHAAWEPVADAEHAEHAEHSTAADGCGSPTADEFIKSSPTSAAIQVSSMKQCMR